MFEVHMSILFRNTIRWTKMLKLLGFVLIITCSAFSEEFADFIQLQDLQILESNFSNQTPRPLEANLSAGFQRRYSSISVQEIADMYIHFNLHPFPRRPYDVQKIHLYDLSSLRRSDFKRNVKTVIVVHGFWPNSSALTPVEVIRGYHQTGENSNYIYMDWSHLSTPSPGSRSPLNALKAYVEIVFENIPIASVKLCNFINFLHVHNYVELRDIHIVGYSLGAHVAGFAGHLIQVTNYGEKIGRITGLDPASPLFRNVLPTHRLRWEDAAFVDVYHTAMNTFGPHRQDGHVDFYPNNGRSPQPGCLAQELTKPIVCSHLFVLKLYIDTINKHYIACKCEPFVDLIFAAICIGGCRHRILAGAPCPTDARGRYYFQTSPMI